MVDVSVGCINENTYGVSCVKCRQCGRKFTSHGIDDSNVIPMKINSELSKDISFKLVNNQIVMEGSVCLL